MYIRNALPETNIAPENRPSQKETNVPTIHFQVRTLSFRKGSTYVCLDVAFLVPIAFPV